MGLNKHKGEHSAAEEQQHHALAEAERGAPLQLWFALEPAHHQPEAARGGVRLERARESLVSVPVTSQWCAQEAAGQG